MKNLFLMCFTAVTLALFSCDDDKAEEEDAGPDGGCAVECDDTDWD